MADEKPDGQQQDPPDPRRTQRQRESLVRTEGSLERALDNLIDQTANLRRANRELKDKLPKEGSVVLTADEAKVWGELQKIGLPAGEISQKLTEGTAAQQKLTLFERDRVADQIADLTKQHAPTLRAVVRLHNLNIALQDRTDPTGALDSEGKKKKVRVPVVIPEGENQEPVEWKEYVEQNLGDFREALAGSETERNGSREPPAGPRITRQRGGESGTGRTVADESIEKEVRARHAGMSI